MGALSTINSLLASSALSLLLFAGMQVFKHTLSSNEWMTIFGGFLGSLLFIFLLTAVSNFENFMFGKGFQAQLIPEILFCLLISLFSSGLVHRVCVTTCFIFSLVHLYYINSLCTHSTTASVATPLPAASKTTKKRN